MQYEFMKLATSLVFLLLLFCLVSEIYQDLLRMLEDKRFNACSKEVAGLNFSCLSGIDLNFSNSLLRFGLLLSCFACISLGINLG